MTTRRTVLRMAGALPAAALLTACQPTDPPPPPASTRAGTRLTVELPTGIALVDAATGQLLRPASPGTTAWDGSALVAAAAARIEVIGSTGRLDYTVDAAAGLSPRVVSPFGNHLALASGRAAAASTPYRPEGRSSTSIEVVSKGNRRSFTVDGCVEPEAFSSSGQVLYVLDYRPPLAPDTYRVRMIDVQTGTYGPLLTRDKRLIPAGAEEEMRGEGRQAVFARQRQLLFTLYTHQPDHEHTRDLLAGARDDAPQVHAFVHTLSLDGQFAYCIDLPAPFGHQPAASHAIALTPISEVPYVVDVASGTIAVLDPDQLTVRSVSTPLPPSKATAAAAVSLTGDTLYVAAGSALHLVQTPGVRLTRTISLNSEVRGLVTGGGSGLVWAGQDDEVVAIDPTTGAIAAKVPVPGLQALRNVVG